MANVNQIYALVNSAAKEALGAEAIVAKDTGSLVSLGKQVLSSETSIEKFYNTLLDRVGKTVIAVRSYDAKKRSVMRDELTWGCILQKISYKHKDAVSNPAWVAETQASPYDIEMSTEIVQKLFSKISTWSYEDSIPDNLFTAFTSESSMSAFVSGIYTNIYNAMEVADEVVANLAVDTAMAGCLIQGTDAQKRNLLKEYNDATGAALTKANALRNKDFLQFASREINSVVKRMSKMSTVFNAEGMDRFTPDEKMVVEVLADFATATASYLESSTYHDELVKLPRYEEVTYWQGSGTAFDFADTSKISIKNAELATLENVNGEIEQDGIIAFVHDVDQCASILARKRNASVYNPRAERLNIMFKADQGYAVDLSENGVVFYLGEQ